jgi:hypothetical protein
MVLMSSLDIVVTTAAKLKGGAAVRGTNMEEYKDLDLPFKYQVSNLGNVKTQFGSYAGLIKSQRVDSSGDAVVGIYNGKKLKDKKVFRLVLLAFFGENRPWARVRHKDGNKLNNSVENLEVLG